MGPNRRIDAHNPQASEVTLFGPTVGKGVLASLEPGLLGQTVDLFSPMAIAFGFMQQIFMSFVGGQAAFNSCHMNLISFGKSQMPKSKFQKIRICLLYAIRQHAP
jgi:hypothetical protein